MVNVRCGTVIFEQIEAIVFDKDGTLANSQEFLRLLGRRRARLLDARIPGTADSMLMAYGIEGDRLDPTSLLAIGSRQENLIAAAAYVAETGRGWWESLRMATEVFAEADAQLATMETETTSPLFVGSLELLAQLHDRGLKLGILSADTTARVEDFVRVHGLDPYIELEMGVDRGPSKPDPGLFLEACARLGVAPSHALMVGDSPLDIQMAQTAGAAGAIGICWGTAIAAHLDQADVTIRRLDEITIND
ncbi:MAG: HAD family hydrolase [Oscillatoriales cyanobacterium]|jgi:phosphoglycolate phosphatase|nr:MAG: HAD family hydrolase [Oscillatoriales cyanobacterium]